MQEPLISFVIPCYNDDPEHLATAVESALAQNSGRIEVILVDDGSSRSDTIVALESLASAEVRLLRQENRGPGAARNAGIKAALGQYLVTLDADDFVNPEFIDACFRVHSRCGPRLQRGALSLARWQRISAGSGASPDSAGLHGWEPHQFMRVLPEITRGQRRGIFRGQEHPFRRLCVLRSYACDQRESTGSVCARRGSKLSPASRVPIV